MPAAIQWRVPIETGKDFPLCLGSEKLTPVVSVPGEAFSVIDFGLYLFFDALRAIDTLPLD